ncbi:hypothetical protein ABTM96_19640, partial [Acinetobacter baumannii]
MASLLPRFDHARHEVVLYSNSHDEDAVSAKLAGQAKVWRRIFGLSDSVVADQIRSDEVDVLVDLSGHSALNRLGVFAMKPCAVQAT